MLDNIPGNFYTMHLPGNFYTMNQELHMHLFIEV